MADGPRFMIDRIEQPRAISNPMVSDYQGDYEQYGAQPEWGWAIPPMYELLNSSNRIGRFPRFSHARDGFTDHSVSLAYWNALIHLLVYSFGWRQPGRGMLRWYQDGKPLDDVRFQLIHDLWHADGSLDDFVYWLLDRFEQGASGVEVLDHLVGKEPSHPAPASPDSAWLAQWIDVPTAPGEQSAGYGLHLEVHWTTPLDEVRDPASTTLKSPKSDRRAAFLADSMIGWYRQLHEVKLPDLGDRSWYVDVVVKPVGHLGTFRRSRQTGRYFAGPHRYHLYGH
ncbi:MAG: hypothetical protein CL424_06795 [Acidimicrobiaceae bacterium]|nr:hypothetical protein [Acidimicrobiaceae bacterium]